MIKDAFGVEVQMGDEIAFARGSRGAQEFGIAEVVKITTKCIYFVGRSGSIWDTSDTELRRTAGCFVINKEKRNANH
jgi:hypothetical protein